MGEWGGGKWWTIYIASLGVDLMKLWASELESYNNYKLDEEPQNLGLPLALNWVGCEEMR